MVETITLSKVYAEDLALGTGTRSITLADGSSETLSEISLSTFGATDLTEGSVVFINSSLNLTEDNTNLFFDDTNNELRVPNIVGSSSASGTITINGTSNATSGAVIISDDEGEVGVGGTPSSVTALHVMRAGATQLRIENTSGAIEGDSFITFLRSTTPKFAMGVDDSDSDIFKINTGVALGANPSLAINGQIVSINDTTNANMTIGLNINQGANDNEILSLKSSDVGHGITSVAETTVYARFIKFDFDEGGVEITGLSEGDVGIELAGFVTSENTVKSNAADAPVMTDSRLKSGTTVTSLATANANVFAVTNAGSTLFIVDIEGDLHVDGSGTLTTFDEHDDIRLLSAVRTLSAPDLRRTLGDWVDEHLDILEQHHVITREPGSNPFISYKGMMGLMIDTMRQMSGRIETLETKLLNPPASA